MDINNFSDEDLKQLMKKYKEKQELKQLCFNNQALRYPFKTKIAMAPMYLGNEALKNIHSEEKQKQNNENK